MNPLAIWATMAGLGIAIPVIIHLLYRKHRQQTKWAAMELLRRALVTRSGQVRLENYLILFLRCLAMVLIAAALWRPTVNTSSLPGKQGVGMVIAIDASLSMEQGNVTRFKKALDIVKKQILSNAGESDRVTLVLMSSRPQILLRRSPFSRKAVEELLDTQAHATPQRLNLEQNLEQLERLVGEMNEPIQECYLVTDAQETDWSALSSQAFQSFNRLKEKASVFVVPVEPESSTNVSITDLSFASGSLHRSGHARIVAKISNHSPVTAKGGTVTFFIDRQAVAKRSVGTLRAGETIAVDFQTSFVEEGDVQLRAELSTNDLKADNVRHAILHIERRVSVLCIHDERARRGSLRRGTYYAAKAFQSLDVTQIHASNLSLENLAKYDVVLMANVASLPKSSVDRLKGFAKNGGALIFFVGHRVKPEAYNTLFGTDKDGLLPAILDQPVSVSADNSWTFGPTTSEHSMSVLVSRVPAAIRDTARFTKVLRAKPAALSQTVLTVGQENLPLALTRDFGAGSVLLFTTTADRTWNQLPIHPLYTMLLNQAASTMTSKQSARNVIVGDSALVPIPERQPGKNVTVRTPQGQAFEVTITQSGVYPVCKVDTHQVGVHEILLGEGEDAPRALMASNVDPAESNVAVVSESILKRNLSPLDVEVVSKDKLANAIVESRTGRSLTILLLALGIFVFLLQSFLAKYFTNRMSQPDVDVAESLQMSRVAAARRT